MAFAMLYTLDFY